jgi:predicted ATPase/DNA-binding SARP family transcriptional activator
VTSPLALYLLGPPRIERDGVPIEVNRRKAVALVAYLAVTAQSHPRDSLVNLLWPDYDSSRGRAALRRTLFTLRNALGEDSILVDRDRLSLVPGDNLQVDVDQFHQHLAACQTHGHPASEVCPACTGPLTEAVALARGEFMSGFGLRDSVNFDDWQLFQAEQIRRELDGALQRLVRWHSSQREFQLAANYARRRLALDPLDEGAHRQLMQLHAWSGRRSAALRQYQDCAAILEDQLGVPPQEETTQLFLAIQEGRAPPPPDEPRAQEPALPLPPSAELPPFLQQDIPAETPIFVARESELAQLDQYLQQALDGQGKVVFVTGEAGSGKTALIQEFARRALDSHADLVVATGHCNAHTGIGDPYLPFREILGQLAGDVEAQWAAGAMTREQARRLWSTLPLTAQALLEAGPDLIETFLLPSALLDRARAVAPQSEGWLIRLAERVRQKPSPRFGIAGPQQSDLFGQYTRVLQALTQQGPLLLVVDDLQWADLGSISLLFHLGRQLARCRILMVGIYRPEEIALGRIDAAAGSEQRVRHPLAPVINELQRDFGNITVDLDQAEGRDFVQALLDSEPNRLDDAFRQALHQRTLGHPLFTIELLRGLQERGDLLRDREAYWVEGKALDWEKLPARIEAVIAERIGRLPQPLRDALRIASVEGDTFTAEVVARAGIADERDIVRWFSQTLDRRHRLVSARGIARLGHQRLSQYRFRHILYQRYLYNTLDGVERVYLHEQVAMALEELYGPGETGAIAVQLARHFEVAGMMERAVYYLQQAWERALQLSAYQDGLAHLRRGLALLMNLPHSPERDEHELALQLALGVAWQGVKGTQALEMKEAYSRARELCHQLGDTARLCQVLGELALHHFTRAEHQRARAFGEQAVDVASRLKDPFLEAMGHWYLGVVLNHLGEYATAQAHLDSVLAFYVPQKHHLAFVLLRGSDVGVSAMAYTACTLWCLGFQEQAVKRSQDALTLARDFNQPFTLVDALNYAGCTFDIMRRDAQGLKGHAEEMTRLIRDKVPGWSRTGQLFEGAALAMLGRGQEGLEQMREAIIVLRARGALIDLSILLSSVAEAQARAGQLENGLVTLAEALAFADETDERLYEAELHRQRGELLLMQRNEDEAEASFHKAIDVARRQSARSWELRATTSLARLWQRQGKKDEARQALAEIYRWFTEGFDTRDLQEAKALLDELS